jgi:hypothetical protein
MSKALWDLQRKQIQRAMDAKGCCQMSFEEQTEAMNSIVTPCPDKPWWKIFTRRHDYRNVSALTSTQMYTVHRCDKCGFIELSRVYCGRAY